jgi:two-component system CheB/CheR fusion protein
MKKSEESVDILKQRLEESEARFRSIMDRSFGGFLILSPEGTILYANSTAVTLFRKSREDLEGSSFGHPLGAGETVRIDLPGHGEGVRHVEMRAAATVWEGKDALLVELRDITELKRTSDRLIHSERQLKNIVAHIPGEIFQFDLTDDDTYEFTYLSTGLETLGLDTTPGTLEELPGKLFPYTEDETREELRRRISESRESNKPLFFEFPHILASGSIRWYDLFAQCYPDPEYGTLFYGILLDVDKQKRMRDRVETSERKLKTLFKATPDILSIMRVETGVFVDVNDAFETITGYNRDQVLGKTTLDIGLVPDSAQRKTFYRDLNQNGEIHDFELTIRTLHGEERILLMSAELLEVEGDSLMVAHSKDITARKRAERDLRESEHKFRGVVEQSHDGIVLINERGHIAEWNRSAEEITGIPRTEALGVSIDTIHWSLLKEDLKNEESRGLLEEKTRLLLEGVPYHDQDFRFREVPITTPGGEEKIIQVTSFPIQTGKGHLVCEILRDVTERKAYERDLIEAKETAEQANLAKSQFLAKMSHEIRTPMNGILGMTELALETAETEEEREYLQIVKDSGLSLLTIINDILDISKVEAGKLELLEEEFSLGEITESLIRSLAPIAEKKNLNLESGITPSVPDRLVGDEARVRQILYNLLGNALKFTEEGEVRLDIDARTGEDQTAPGDAVRAGEKVELSIRVSDTGIGISEDLHDRIFEDFKQIDNTFARRYSGTGLGLAISKQLIEMMGGRIWLESEPGKGSVFHFTLRLTEAVPAEQPKPEPSAWRGEAGGASLHILVVDDNFVNRKVITKFLDKLGHSSETAPSGKEALESARKNRYDLVLMDIEMPEMSGVETAELLRGFENTATPSEVPIIALTAHALTGDRERFLEAGMDGYVSKPIELDELREALNPYRERKISAGAGTETGTSRPDGSAPAGRMSPSLAQPPEGHPAPGESPSGPTAPPLLTRETERYKAKAAELKNLYSEDLRSLTMVYSLILEAVPRGLRDMRRALDGMDCGTVRSRAHTMINHVGVLGLEEIVEELRCVIDACKAKDPGLVAECLTHLEPRIETVLRVVREEHSQLSDGG